jgi:protein phosphatase methylesterase 1
MGGSIATKTFDHMEKNKADYPEISHIKGLFIIDVVEGSAMDALPFMESIVSSRPQQFSNIQSVVKYGINSSTVRNLASAKVSMPAQVVKKTDPKGQVVYVWRTDLLASKQYWTEWFTGLTQSFLKL